MLGGLDPIIIFQFSKLAPTLGQALAKIPLVAKAPSLIAMPPIPIYLSESITGLYVDTESKSIDIQTDIETKTDGTEADVNQKGLGAETSVTLLCKKNSLSLILLSSLMDVVLDKATSKEYSVSYLHGAVTIFRAGISSFVVEQTAQTDLASVKIGFSKGAKSPVKGPEVPVVGANVGAVPLR